MDVFEAVRTVLAVRSYRPDSIPQEVVARIVEAGRLTGSSMNGQPWHFVVVDDKSTIQRMGQLAQERTLHHPGAVLSSSSPSARPRTAFRTAAARSSPWS